MNLEIFPERWRDSIAALAAEYSIRNPELYEPGNMFQAPADMLVWAPETLPSDIDDQIEYLCKRVNGFLFLALPWEAKEQPHLWKDKIERQLSIRDWVAFEHPEKMVVCSARKFNDWRIGNVVGAMTKEQRLEQIMHNIHTYPQRVKVGRPEHSTPLVMVCYGPSIHQTWQSAKSEAALLKADIATNSGAHDFLIKKGIVPKYHVEIDPRPERAKFTETPHKSVEYMIASVCHADLTAKLAPYNMKLYHLHDGAESLEIFKHEPEAILIDGGASVALRSLSLFYSMGYRHFSIYGFDCSFRDDMQWAGEHPGKPHKVVEAKIEGVDRVFKTSSALVTYATQFVEHVNRLPDARFYLHGDGFLQQWCKQNMFMHQLELSKKAVA